MTRPLLRTSLALAACAILVTITPSLAFGGGPGGGGHSGGGHGGVAGASHGHGSLRLHGRHGGSGFGYNGGAFGQGTYLPYGQGACLRQVDGPYGPRLVRVC